MTSRVLTLAQAAIAAGMLLTSAAQAQDTGSSAGISPWGPADEIGTLNMMTDDSRTDILGRIAGGKIYDLAVEMFVGMPNCCADFGDPNYQSWMTHSPSRGETHEHLSYSGDGVSMYTHTGTHIDALNHFGLHGEIWNKVKAEDALETRGWTKSGVDKYPPIVARGVMIDVAASKGVDVLPPSYAVTVDDLKLALERQGSDLRPGDVVLVRTGLMKVWPDKQKFRLWDQPGLSLDAARWLVEDRKAMLLGADNFGVEAFPSTDPDNFVPVHSYLLAERGVSMLELVWLEDLSAEAVYEFLFIASPLKMRGATASPLRPIAIPVRTVN